MMIPQKLFDGYKRFRGQRYPEQAALYEGLAEGQQPTVMVISCADSRVDPATIFSVSPGELFVVRNVAALVPPYQDPGQTFHGVSAALEFAVNFLCVEHVIVMGHAACGGIKACLDAHTDGPVGQFIGPWVEIAASAREEVLQGVARGDVADQQNALEFSSVKHSLKNLQTFPFVQQRLDKGDLTLHGAWFSIAQGELYWLDPHTATFQMVPA